MKDHPYFIKFNEMKSRKHVRHIGNITLRIRAFYFIYFIFLGPILTRSQNLYFPPPGNGIWDTIGVNALGWCPDKIDTLVNFAGEKNTKSLLILVNGRIALEKYYGNFTQNDFWYWASAGKTITAFLTGIAQQENVLNIDSATSNYLGTGWTSAPPNKEKLIKVYHHLTMTTGLDYNGDFFCAEDTCLNYLSDAGDFWFYYEAPYKVLMRLIEVATNTNFNAYTDIKLEQPIGMQGGFWLGELYFSSTRDAARFGLLILNNGNWNGTPVLADQQYFNQMVNTSQIHNKSYGYLWWLNGKENYMVPGFPFQFPGKLFPDGPDDLIAALGADDQKIYVIPSKNMVVVRFGEAAGPPSLAVSSFDNQLIKRIMDLPCVSTSIETSMLKLIDFFPNPTDKFIYISGLPDNFAGTITIFNELGQKLIQEHKSGSQFDIDVSQFSSNIYIIQVIAVTGEMITRKFIKQ